jgi:hypothetical protein
MSRPNTKESVITRIAESCVVTSTGCWVWTAGTSHDYASMGYQGKVKKVCTLIYELFILDHPIPNGYCVLHKCDNRSCVNPDHLYLGTKADNIRDRCERDPDSFLGRQKITPEQLELIKTMSAQGIHKKILAAHFNVDLRTIQRLVSDK